MLIWLLIVLNLLICAWDSYAAGLLWGIDVKKKGLTRLIAGSALTIGFIGMLYTFVLIGIVFGLVPETYLLAANVILGLPLIAAGIVITIQGWIDTIRNRSFLGGLISVWNTFALIWNIKVWIDSFRAIKELGIVNVLKSDNDSKAKVILFLIVAVITAGLISFGLFKVGKKTSENLIAGTRNVELK